MKKMLKCWLQALVELIMFFPVFLVPAYLMFESYDWVLWLLGVTLAYLFGFLVTRMLKVQMYLITYSAIFLPIIVVCLLLFSTITTILVSIIAFGVGGFRGYSYVKNNEFKHFSVIVYYAGLTAYFISYLIILYVERGQQTSPFTDYLTITGGIAILLTLLLGNVKVLKKEHKAKKGTRAKVASQMLVHNRIFIILFFVASMGLASIGAFSAVLESIRKLVGNWLAQFMNNDSNVGEEMEIDNGDIGAIGGGDPSKVAGNLDSWVIYFVIVVLVIAAIFLVYFIFKKFNKIVEIVSNWLKQKRGFDIQEDENLGYVDEEENLFDLKKSAKGIMNRFKKMFERDEKLSDFKTNAEKIRFIYRYQILKALQKGYNFKSQLTPVETAKDISAWNTDYMPVEDLIQAYNRTRYGKQQIDNEIVNKLKEKM